MTFSTTVRFAFYMRRFVQEIDFDSGFIIRETHLQDGRLGREIKLGAAHVRRDSATGTILEEWFAENGWVASVRCYYSEDFLMDGMYLKRLDPKLRMPGRRRVQRVAPKAEP